MCGRFSVDKGLTPIVSELFNTPFNVDSNSNLSPSQSVATIIKSNSNFSQVNALWGIKPNWSKKLIINAQSETVSSKPTFKQAFQHQRCLVPCNGWYEWRTEEGKKVKYLFEHANKMPVLVLSRDKDSWFNSSQQELESLLGHVEDRVINVQRVDGTSAIS